MTKWKSKSRFANARRDWLNSSFVHGPRAVQGRQIVRIRENSKRRKCT